MRVLQRTLKSSAALETSKAARAVKKAKLVRVHYSQAQTANCCLIHSASTPRPMLLRSRPSCRLSRRLISLRSPPTLSTAAHPQILRRRSLRHGTAFSAFPPSPPRSRPSAPSRSVRGVIVCQCARCSLDCAAPVVQPKKPSGEPAKTPSDAASRKRAAADSSDSSSSSDDDVDDKRSSVCGIPCVSALF